MALTDIDSKQTQFNEFFSINYIFNVNVSPIKTETPPTFEQFSQQIPTPFKMANDIVDIDQSSLQGLKELNGVTTQLLNFLRQQNQKINLLINYIIEQQNSPQIAYSGIKLGGGGLIFTAEQGFTLGSYIELKIFLTDYNSAVYCLAEIIEIQQAGDYYQHKVIFHHIRDEDREVLVRTSLHEQTKQLQQLSQQRKNDQKKTDNNKI